MTNLQPIIDDLLYLQEKLARLPFPHPWDNHVAKNSVARIDALLSDLRVVACRMREDQPRVTYDPATDQAVAVETAEWMVSGIPHRTNPQTGKMEPIPVWTLPSPTFSPQAQQAMLAECDDPQPDPQTITESLMRAAQVGWRGSVACGQSVKVVKVIREGLWVVTSNRGWSMFYDFDAAGRHSDPGWDIVSLTPPEVVDDVAEVLL